METVYDGRFEMSGVSGADAAWAPDKTKKPATRAADIRVGIEYEALLTSYFTY
jgi:hypothetical protein